MDEREREREREREMRISQKTGMSNAKRKAAREIDDIILRRIIANSGET